MKKGLLFCGFIVAITLLCCYALVTADVVQKKTGGVAVTSRSATSLQLPISNEPIRTAKTAEPEKAASESAAALSFETEIVRPVAAPATASVPPAALTVTKEPVSTPVRLERAPKQTEKERAYAAKLAKAQRIEELFQRIQELKEQGLEHATLWNELNQLLGGDEPRAHGHLDATGDDCTDPIIVTLPAALPYADADQTNCGRGNTYSATCLGGYDGGEDIIYELTVTATICVDITLDPGATTWTGIAIDDECPPADPCMDYSTSYSAAPHGMTGVLLDPGTYYIMIDTYPTPDCIPLFDLGIDTCAPPPTNDSCHTATVILSLPYTDSGNTCAAHNVCGNDAPDVFYKYTVQEPNELLTISLCQSGYDTYLWVWSECCVTEITHNDDGCGLQSEIVDCFYPGDIWIQVEGYSSNCGDFVLDVSSAGPCPEPPECPENTTFGQVVHLPEEAWTAGVSDLRTGSGYDPLIRYESFSGVTSPTCEIHFWGLSLMNPWAECDEDPMTFEIKFYQDAAGVPGAEMCSNTVTISGHGTGLFYMDFPLYYYSATLDPCCFIAEGWVSIQATSVGSPTDCWFLWMSSGMGDGMSLLWDGLVMTEEAFDLGMCLVGTGDLIGACCIPETGDCQDGVAAADCQGIFYGNTTCAELDIPCGYGACCNDSTAECTFTTFAECQAPSRTWHPGIDCDPNPCEQVCPYPDRDVEPDNNTCPLASPACYVLCEDTLCGEIQVSDDEDYYEFVIAPGETYQLFIDVFADDTPGYWTYGQGLDPQVRVYNASCAQIFYDDDGGEGWDSYLETDVLSAGTYYIHVKGFSSSTGPYILSVYCVPGAPNCDDWVLCCEPGETEPNDICDDPVDPHTIACEDTICGKVCPDGEHDIYAIVVPPETIMSISLYDGHTCSQRPTTCIANDLLRADCSVEGSGNTAGWQLTNDLTEPWYLYLDVYQTSPGCWAKYKIVTRCCQITDYCEDPIIIPNVYHYENTISTCCGTDPVPIVWSEYNCSGSDYTSGPDVVYQISIGEPGVLDIVVSGPRDNQVMVFIDCADPTNTCVGSADNTFTGDDEEILGLSLLAGTYFISTSVYYTSCDEMTIVIDSDVLLTVESPTEALIPTEYALHQNYPNPFNPTTTIRYDVKETGLVTLKVFDLLGRETATLVSEKLMPGSYTVAWDASSFPSGVYFCRMEAKEFTQIRKLLLVK